MYSGILSAFVLLFYLLDLGFALSSLKCEPLDVSRMSGGRQPPRGFGVASFCIFPHLGPFWWPQRQAGLRLGQCR